jgi:hypothetical protein
MKDAFRIAVLLVAGMVAGCTGGGGGGGGSSPSSAKGANPQPTTQELIAQALAEGRIDLSTSLVYRMWALFLDGQLPPEYDGPGLGAEDNALFEDIRLIWDTLPSDAQAALQPYLLRPTDPGSPFHVSGSSATSAQQQAAVRRLAPAGTHLLATDESSPPVPLTPCADSDWIPRNASIAYVKVWVCKSTDNTQDNTILSNVIGIYDRHWDEMTFDMGVPRHDDGAGGDDRIDVYVIELGNCINRGGTCKGIPKPAPNKPQPPYAITPPWVAAAGSPGGTSGYQILRRDRAIKNDLPFEADAVHEFYHVLQYAHIQSSDRIVISSTGKEFDRSWFVEASAKWAEWAYVPASSPTEVHPWYPANYDDNDQQFAVYRYQPGQLSLLEQGNFHEYASYIWPYFMQQELLGPEKVGNAWKAADFANGPEAIDRAINAQLSFADHLGDFMVRNLNHVFPGDPLKTHFWDMDPQFPKTADAAHPVINRTDLYPRTELAFGMQRFPIDFEVYNLAASYSALKVPLTSGIQHVLFEFEANEPDALNVESVAEVVNMTGDNYWKRFSSTDGRRLEFCLKNPEQNVDNIILMLGNHNFNRSGTSIIPPKTKGTMYVTTDENCGEWTGTITYTFKNLYREETKNELGTAVTQAHEVMTQSWAVKGVKPDPDLPFYQQLTLSWVAIDEVNDTYDLTPSVPCGNNTLHSSTTGTKGLEGTLLYDVYPGLDGAFTLGPPYGVAPPPSPTLDWTPAFDEVSCDGYEVTGDGAPRTISDQLGSALAIYGPISGFTPDPKDPTHYMGINTVTVAPDVTATVTWDLHHYATQ